MEFNIKLFFLFFVKENNINHRFHFFFFFTSSVGNCLAHVRERLGAPGSVEIILGNFEWNKPHDKTIVRKVKILLLKFDLNYVIVGGNINQESQGFWLDP